MFEILNTVLLLESPSSYGGPGCLSSPAWAALRAASRPWARRYPAYPYRPVQHHPSAPAGAFAPEGRARPPPTHETAGNCGWRWPVTNHGWHIVPAVQGRGVPRPVAPRARQRSRSGLPTMRAPRRAAAGLPALSGRSGQARLTPTGETARVW